MVAKTSGARRALLTAMSHDISDQAGVPQEISQEILNGGVVCAFKIPSTLNKFPEYNVEVGFIDYSRTVASEENGALWPTRQPLIIARFALGKAIKYEVDGSKDKLILPEDCNYFSVAKPPALDSMAPQLEPRYLASSKEGFIWLPRIARRLGEHSLANSLYAINEFLQRFSNR